MDRVGVEPLGSGSSKPPDAGFVPGWACARCIQELPTAQINSVFQFNSCKRVSSLRYLLAS